MATRAEARSAGGRRRTRAQAALESTERRERLKRTRVEMEAMTRGRKRPSPSKTAAAAATEQAPAPAPATPSRVPKAKAVVVVGASLGSDLLVEHTPTKRTPTPTPTSPPQPLPRRGQDATITTPDKSGSLATPASLHHKQKKTQRQTQRDDLHLQQTDKRARTSATEVQRTPRSRSRSHSCSRSRSRTCSQSETASRHGSVTESVAADRAFVATRRLPARGIAQSCSASSTRKRMISFSPERTERVVNEAAARQKLQRNLKATEKLQLRLDGVSVKSPDKSTAAKPSAGTVAMPKTTPVKPPMTATPTAIATAGPTTPVARPASTAQSPPLRNVHATPPARATSLVFSSPADTLPSLPPSQTPADRSVTLELPPSDVDTPAAATAVLSSPPERSPLSSPAPDSGATASCRKELTFVALEAASEMASQDEVDPSGSQLSELDASTQGTRQSTAPVTKPAMTEEEEEEAVAFTSTSVIEDVGLFNCDTDVELSGGVYGEGTDGKVSAATVRGQKVALKRAKPHDGFPEEEAKRRSAMELYYLRRARHLPGFVQCLGICDGIEHTCIALEVMDCKLSDYLRRQRTTTDVESPSVDTQTQTHAASTTKTTKTTRGKRRGTLPLALTRSLLKQICQPMVVLHEQINVAHGDLACRNILLHTPPTGYEHKWEPLLKLSDFGRIRTPASEPPLFMGDFSFFKNADVGAFAREILYRLLVGEIVPAKCTETRHLHKHLQDVVVTSVPESARQRLGPFYPLFMRCTGWGVRPSFREILAHLDDLEYFDTTETGLFPLKPAGGVGVGATTNALATDNGAAFLSPVMDATTAMGAGARAGKVPSASGSRGNNHKYETPSTATMRPSTKPGGGPRLLGPKPGGGDAHGAAPSAKLVGAKAVHWLKARSVLSGGAQPPSLHKLHPRSLHTVIGVTPGSTPLASASVAAAGAGAGAAPSKTPATTAKQPRKTKTPPSAGASRRSLQILNQIQHRMEKEKRRHTLDG